MYKFQDDLGRWHYSDAKPQEGMAKSLEVSQVAMDPATAVSLENRDAEGRRQVFASNRWAGPVEVEVTPLEVVNMLVEPPLPHRFVLAGGAVAAPIIDMRLADSRQTGTVRYGYRYTPGDPSAQPEENHAYLPPLRRAALTRYRRDFWRIQPPRRAKPVCDRHRHAGRDAGPRDAGRRGDGGGKRFL